MRKLFILAMALVLLISFSQASFADDDEINALRKEMQQLRQDYEAKIQALQKQVNALGKKQDKKVAQIEKKIDKKLLDVEYVGRYEGPFQKGGLLIKNPSGFGNVSMGGYIDHEFENFQKTNSNFDQHRWVINIGAELTDRLRFYSEYEIEHGGPNAQNSGQGEAKVEQAWVDYIISDAINLRAGALLVPFGRYNLYHDSDLQDLTERPLVARDVIPTTWTESGVGFHGTFNPEIGNNDDLELGYELYVVNGLDGSTDTGFSKGSLSADNNNSKAVVGRLVVSPSIGHEVGFSGYWGEYDAVRNDILGGAIDIFSPWGPLELVGEFAYFEIGNPEGGNAPELSTGYYIQANYHFWPEFLDDTFLARDFDDPTLTLVTRYGAARIGDDGTGLVGENKEDRVTLGFNYRPLESWVAKFEYIWTHTQRDTLEKGDNSGLIASIAMGF